MEIKNKLVYKILIYSVMAFLLISNVITLVLLISNKTTKEIYNENILKVVEIKVSDDEETWGYATGCFVSEDGKILTNKHVVYNASTSLLYTHIKVRLATSEEFADATVLSISSTDDLAVIQTEKTDCDYYQIQTEVNNGEKIYTIGNPNNFGLSFTEGVVSSNLRNVTYNETTIGALQTSLVINEGNSGGPVFNTSGKLVGLISFRLKDKSLEIIQGVSFAVPAQKIQAFLSSI